ncbi:MAG: peroxidase [Acidobacteriota bacterium]
MAAHAEDLRAEIPDQRRGRALAEGLRRDYRRVDLPDPDRRMLDFAVKLTRTPSRMTEQDIAVLRRHGFSDEAIHDIVQVTALFNYYNRLADGVGIDPEA